ncbi:hypothetical protein AKJ09_08944 [Labilithrix luteola]|uniref:Cytochrome c domain-containing protein n=1 Tax=Labilithrix luteola TaxID=1391654 RepID=A0A0K1Q917_9BACT|nr:hypothetical protein [Labilithrix luteola]AKV02281.1 hypothetical protein AKJ09_08944 [Labilithrix luteola]
MRASTHRGYLCAIVAIVLGVALASCDDPVHSDAVDALGPEVAGIPRGPRHRAGQPCLTCHGGDGPGSPDFSFGGTVFLVRGGTQGVPGVTVLLKDARGATIARSTNEVGNFYIQKSEWSPVFPVFATISYAGEERPMATRIGGSGSCATCHRGSGDAQHMPGVFLRDQ